MSKQIMMVLPLQFHDMFYSMALDEICFVNCQEKGIGHISIHSFNQSCTSIGYFQKFNKLSIKDDNLVTRRITGGGVVNHKNEIILSLSYKYPNNNKNVSHHYKVIHSVIIQTLEESGVDCRIFQEQKILKDNYLCFNSPVQYDIIKDNLKIVGGAMCRKKQAFLYQGSIQSAMFEKKVCKDEFRKKIINNLAIILNLDCHNELKMLPEMEEKVQLVKDNKYLNIGWIRKF